MEFITIFEMQMAAEHIQYLQERNSKGDKDELIYHAELAYSRLANSICAEEEAES